jgi:phosphohistidine phosphatase
MADVHALYLIRHAIAADRGPKYSDDATRPLTQHGTSRFRKVVRGLSEMGVEVDLILSSPLVRARETADLLSQELRVHPPVVETPALIPGSAYPNVLAELARHARMPSIAMVGHEPGLGEIAARLVGSSAGFEFKKGGVCRIDLDRLPPTGPGRLVWLATPRMLMAMRGKGPGA